MFEASQLQTSLPGGILPLFLTTSSCALNPSSQATTAAAAAALHDPISPGIVTAYPLFVLVVLILRHLLPLILGANTRLRPGNRRGHTLLHLPDLLHGLDAGLGSILLGGLLIRDRRLDLCLAILAGLACLLLLLLLFFLLLLFLLGLCLLGALVSRQLRGEPVDAPPQAGGQDGEDDAVDAVGREEHGEQDELQGGEGDVGRFEEGRGWAGGEDAFPELDEEGRHGGGGDGESGKIMRVRYQCGLVISPYDVKLSRYWERDVRGNALQSTAAAAVKVLRRRNGRFVFMYVY